MSLDIEDLDLGATLLSGQAFRWNPDGAWFCGFIGNTPVRLQTRGNRLIAEWSPDGRAGDHLPADGVIAASLRSYLDLDRDYAAIRAEAAERLPALREAMVFSRGLRVLRQDPWETLVSFIISACNNVPRITRIVSKMCRGGSAFPSAGELAAAGEESLRRLGLGYRAPYVASAARMVESGELDLEALRTMPTAEARRRLMSAPGVGGKVADCVLLYGLQRYDVVPVDVWIKRIIEGLLLGGREMSTGRVRAWAVENLGPHAGIIQVCLFHYARSTRFRDPHTTCAPSTLSI